MKHSSFLLLFSTFLLFSCGSSKKATIDTDSLYEDDTDDVISQTIEENDGISQNELAHFANRNKSSLTRMINTLIAKDFITKCVSESDNRKNHIHITKLGEEVLEKAIPHFRKMALNIEEHLSSLEIEQTKRILKKIQENVSGQEAGPFFN